MISQLFVFSCRGQWRLQGMTPLDYTFQVWRRGDGGSETRRKKEKGREEGEREGALGKGDG